MTDRERIIQLFFFGFLALMAYELYELLSPFLMPIAWAILLAFMVHPVQLELRKFVKSTSLTAVIITLVVATGVILPAIWLSERLTTEAQMLYGEVSGFVKAGGIKQVNDWLQHSRLAPYANRLGVGRLDSDKDVSKFFVEGAQFTSQYLIKNVTTAARSVVGIVIDFGIVLMTFFYLLRDGESYYDSIRHLTPLHEDDKEVIFDTLRSTLSSVMRGLLLTALVQGVAIGVGLLFTGMPYWAFLAVVSAACGLLPFGGTALVWVPSAGYLAWAVSYAAATVLVVWCVIWVAVIDNFIKPLVMRHGTGLPTLALFFGIAGGLEVYGPIGIFAGPAIISIFAALLRVYRKTYGESERRQPPHRRAMP
jgi:predicted PurR-regulated permease PerM